MSNIEQHAISEMFNRIARNYDRTNRILSFGRDIYWRTMIAHYFPDEPGVVAVDAATGTADLLIMLLKKRPSIKHFYGIDIAENMLKLGQRKLTALGFNNRATLQKADATNLPFETQSVDVVTIAFGIRNIVNMPGALKEFFRVLKPGGRLLILEFSMPKQPLVNMGYTIYFRHVLPWLGSILTKDAKAYRYLNSSVEQFIKPKELEKLILDNDFSTVEIKPLTFGVATIYCARKL